MLRVIIVEDDSKTANTIKQIVSSYIQEIEIVAITSSIKDSVVSINQEKPDLLLMDIHLKDGLSFEIFENITFDDFKIIFITAHEEFAIRAIKFSALEYILKPINPKELTEALDKTLQSFKTENDYIKLKVLEKNLTDKEKKLVLNTSNSINLIDIKDIVRCEADGGYTKFFLSDKRIITISKPLKEYDELLHDMNFFRVHQSHLINFKCIDRYEKADGGYLVMNDKSNVPVSVRRKELLFELFDKLSFNQQ